MATFNTLITGIAVASFTIFQLLFHVLSSWASTRITPAFNNLNQKRKIEWNSRTVSTFHALVVGAFCVYILLYDEAVNADHVWGDPSIVKLNIAITTGYLISDLFLITYYWKAIGDKFFVIHHLAALYAYYFVLDEGMLAYFGNFRLLAEFSTPFVNQRTSSDVHGRWGKFENVGRSEYGRDANLREFCFLPYNCCGGARCFVVVFACWNNAFFT
ncbi:TLC domain-containing protein 4 isoform X2 [Natator depressus]|uniref:TLC domain-containing protein 4 isoform X2 n=1 Tax=Natator depressus TaxID=27790 RepID=UPI003EBE427F